MYMMYICMYMMYEHVYVYIYICIRCVLYDLYVYLLLFRNDAGTDWKLSFL